MLIKTEAGFECEISQARLENMRLLDAIVESQKDELKIIDVITLLLGKENKERLYDHYQDENGIVSALKIAEVITEIFNLVGKEGKN